MDIAPRLLAALACLAACHAAQADRFRLDYEDVVEVGDCELEIASERHSARGAATEREQSIQLGCGIGWRTELVATLARRRSDGERSRAIDIEAKTSLFDRPKGGIAWALDYGASAEREPPGSWRWTEHFLALEAAYRPAEAWVIEAQLGAARERLERRNRTIWTLAAEHEFSDLLEARAELEGESRSRPMVNVELSYEVWPDVGRINLSCGARTGRTHERRVGLGLVFEF